MIDELLPQGVIIIVEIMPRNFRIVLMHIQVKLISINLFSNIYSTNSS